MKKIESGFNLLKKLDLHNTVYIINSLGSQPDMETHQAIGEKTHQGTKPKEFLFAASIPTSLETE
jgi:hypothetical protein